jgi:hypothetical protein
MGTSRCGRFVRRFGCGPDPEVVAASRGCAWGVESTGIAMSGCSAGSAGGATGSGLARTVGSGPGGAGGGSGARRISVGCGSRPGEGDGIGCGQPRRGGGQRGGEGPGVGIAVGGVGPARPLQHRRQYAQFGGRLEVALDPGQEGGQGRVSGERDRPGDRLHQHEGQRIDVGAGVDDTLDLLRRGVAGGAEHGAGRLGPAGLGQRPGQAEVRHPGRAVLVEEKVGRLHVPVDEAPGVGVVEPAGNLAADGRGLRRAEPVTPVEDAPQAAACQELEDHEGGLVLPPVVDRHDVGMVQGGGHLRLGAEAPEESGVVGQGGVEHLDGDPALEPHVPGRVDAPAGPRPQGGHEAVPSGQDTAGQIGHAARPHPH